MSSKFIVTAVLCSFLILSAAGCAKQSVVKDNALTPGAVTLQGNQTGQKQGGDSSATAAKQASTSTRQSDKGATIAGADRQALLPLSNAAELKPELEKVFFNFDSYALSTSARGALQKDSLIMKNSPTMTVRIEGNCDERGSDEYNMALGERRAQEAKQYLTTLGIPAERLSVISYGKEKPLVQGHNEMSWAKNRRDDLVILHN